MRNKGLLGLCLVGAGISILLINRAPWSNRDAAGAGLEGPAASASAPRTDNPLATPQTAAAETGARLSAAPPEAALALSPDAVPESLEAPFDRSGMTKAEQIQTLLSSYEHAGRIPESGRLHGQFGLASRCVITILRARGLADYGDPAELARLGGFSLRASSNDEWVIAADRARYAFPKGEFPIYDQTRQRVQAQPPGVLGEELSADQAEQLDFLFQDALAALGVPITDARLQPNELR